MTYTRRINILYDIDFYAAYLYIFSKKFEYAYECTSLSSEFSMSDDVTICSARIREKIVKSSTLTRPTM